MRTYPIHLDRWIILLFAQSSSAPDSIALYHKEVACDLRRNSDSIDCTSAERDRVSSM